MRAKVWRKASRNKGSAGPQASRGLHTLGNAPTESGLSISGSQPREPPQTRSAPAQHAAARPERTGRLGDRGRARDSPSSQGSSRSHTWAPRPPQRALGTPEPSLRGHLRPAAGPRGLSTNPRAGRVDRLKAASQRSPCPQEHSNADLCPLHQPRVQDFICLEVVETAPNASLELSTPVIRTPCLPAYAAQFVTQMKMRSVPASGPGTSSVSANLVLSMEKTTWSSARSARLGARMGWWRRVPVPPGEISRVSTKAQVPYQGHCGMFPGSRWTVARALLPLPLLPQVF
ncbi:uncharacterized protein LOC143676701 [Tamandua tetradactyla]|uniref:uncharacterized protein LOC143676701 n=1 Tax=Tamandua tetradactyla TaxID=48850 RepID=UPI0040545BCB